jgi:hypothetical protein
VGQLLRAPQTIVKSGLLRALEFALAEAPSIVEGHAPLGADGDLGLRQSADAAPAQENQNEKTR